MKIFKHKCNLKNKNLLYHYIIKRMSSSNDYRVLRLCVSKENPKTNFSLISNIDDNDYNKFVAFLEDKDFDYVTNSEEELNNLIDEAKKEKYFDQSKAELDALKVKLAHDKNKDLKIFKEEIKSLINEEIVSRYYYQKGRLISLLSSDKEVDKAIEILSDKELYNSILNGTYKKQ